MVCYISPASSPIHGLSVNVQFTLLTVLVDAASNHLVSSLFLVVVCWYLWYYSWSWLTAYLVLRIPRPELVVLLLSWFLATSNYSFFTKTLALRNKIQRLYFKIDINQGTCALKQGAVRKMLCRFASFLKCILLLLCQLSNAFIRLDHLLGSNGCDDLSPSVQSRKTYELVVVLRKVWWWPPCWVNGAARNSHLLFTV